MQSFRVWSCCAVHAFYMPIDKYLEENMETFLMYFLFVVGVVLIVKGGDWFVDGAVWVAEVTRMPKFLIGATIVSLATTLPEIIVSTIAAVD